MSEVKWLPEALADIERVVRFSDLANPAHVSICDLNRADLVLQVLLANALFNKIHHVGNLNTSVE